MPGVEYGISGIAPETSLLVTAANALNRLPLGWDIDAAIATTLRVDAMVTEAAMTLNPGNESSLNKIAKYLFDQFGNLRITEWATSNLMYTKQDMIKKALTQENDSAYDTNSVGLLKSIADFLKSFQAKEGTQISVLNTIVNIITKIINVAEILENPWKTKFPPGVRQMIIGLPDDYMFKTTLQACIPPDDASDDQTMARKEIMQMCTINLLIELFGGVFKLFLNENYEKFARNYTSMVAVSSFVHGFYNAVKHKDNDPYCGTFEDLIGGLVISNVQETVADWLTKDNEGGQLTFQKLFESSLKNNRQMMCYVTRHPSLLPGFRELAGVTTEQIYAGSKAHRDSLVVVSNLGKFKIGVGLSTSALTLRYGDDKAKMLQAGMTAVLSGAMMNFQQESPYTQAAVHLMDGELVASATAYVAATSDDNTLPESCLITVPGYTSSIYVHEHYTGEGKIAITGWELRSDDPMVQNVISTTRELKKALAENSDLDVPKWCEAKGYTCIRIGDSEDHKGQILQNLGKCFEVFKADDSPTLEQFQAGLLQATYGYATSMVYAGFGPAALAMAALKIKDIFTQYITFGIPFCFLPEVDFDNTMTLEAYLNELRAPPMSKKVNQIQAEISNNTYALKGSTAIYRIDGAGYVNRNTKKFTVKKSDDDSDEGEIKNSSDIYVRGKPVKKEAQDQGNLSLSMGTKKTETEKRSNGVEYTIYDEDEAVSFAIAKVAPMQFIDFAKVKNFFKEKYEALTEILNTPKKLLNFQRKKLNKVRGMMLTSKRNFKPMLRLFCNLVRIFNGGNFIHPGDMSAVLRNSDSWTFGLDSNTGITTVDQYINKYDFILQVGMNLHIYDCTTLAIHFKATSINMGVPLIPLQPSGERIAGDDTSVSPPDLPADIPLVEGDTEFIDRAEEYVRLIERPDIEALGVDDYLGAASILKGEDDIIAAAEDENNPLPYRTKNLTPEQREALERIVELNEISEDEGGLPKQIKEAVNSATNFFSSGAKYVGNALGLTGARMRGDATVSFSKMQ